MGILDNITKRAKKVIAKKSPEAKPEVKAEKKTEKKEEKKSVAKQTEKKDEKKPASKKKKSKPTPGPLAREYGGKAAKVLLAPVLTEKAGGQEGLGKYTFFVTLDSTKVEIAEAIRDLYGVKPISVRIIKIKGKRVSSGRIRGKKKNQKKAIVTLQKGDAISLYE